PVGGPSDGPLDGRRDVILEGPVDGPLDGPVGGPSDGRLGGPSQDRSTVPWTALCGRRPRAAPRSFMPPQTPRQRPYTDPRGEFKTDPWPRANRPIGTPLESPRGPRRRPRATRTRKVLRQEQGVFGSGRVAQFVPNQKGSGFVERPNPPSRVGFGFGPRPDPRVAGRSGRRTQNPGRVGLGRTRT
ncbi:hypothetical protein M885DRAFT_440965, partial [Pelagophyceae sp. CCMP2097]